MNAQNIVETLYSKGFPLWVTAGNIHVRPKSDDATRELLRQHKAEIISFLSGEKSPEPLRPPQELQEELFEERAAIMEFDGGLPREEAERRAGRPDRARSFLI